MELFLEILFTALFTNWKKVKRVFNRKSDKVDLNKYQPIC